MPLVFFTLSRVLRLYTRRLHLTDTSPPMPPLDPLRYPSSTVQHTLKMPLVFFTFSRVLRLTGV
eukprot:25356-Prorocentrum_minimum.AAC.1